MTVKREIDTSVSEKQPRVLSSTFAKPPTYRHTQQSAPEKSFINVVVLHALWSSMTLFNEVEMYHAVCYSFRWN